VLELGGNAAVVIHDDADLEEAATRSVTGGFAFSGQVCISLQRAFVQRRFFEKFIDLMVSRTLKLKPGDPAKPDTRIFVMIDEENAIRVESWVNEARERGATLHCGGKRDGNFYEPTILSNVDPSLNISAKEVFGPVVVINPYDEFGEALTAVNDSIYGLQAGVYTNDINRIARAFKELEVGTVIINDVPMYRIDNMPYGGVKGSGSGREGLKYAIEEMTEMKLLVINLER